MIHLFLPTVLLLAPAAEPDAEPRFTESSFALGKVYTVTVTGTALANTPPWKPGEGNPPVSARAAIRSADRVRDRLVKDTARRAWRRERAALRQYDSSWYWEVTYLARLRAGEEVGTVPTLKLIVLMDGAVVEPTVRDDPDGTNDLPPANIPPPPPRPPGVLALVGSIVRGKRYAAAITRAALDRAPGWEAGADNPPVSAREAMRRTGAALGRLAPVLEGWEWGDPSPSLREADGRWYWVVEYEAHLRPRDGELVGGSGPGTYFRLAVLMDGTVVEPEVSDDRPRGRP